MKNMLKIFDARKSSYALNFLVIIFIFYRFYFLPGLSFNTQIWDDEIQWKLDREDRSVLSWIFYRDAPGYFVIFPRILYLIAENIPILTFETNLRLLIIIIQILCLYYASRLISYGRNHPIGFFTFFALLSIWIEDLNYLHNVGYLFIFPVLYLCFYTRNNGPFYQSLKFFAISILIVKPITALILLTILSVSMLLGFIKNRKNVKFFESFLILYCVVYLTAYFALPNRWDTPFNSDVASVIPAVANISWIFGSVLLPYLYVAIPGLINLLELDFSLPYLGFVLYLLPIMFFLKYYKLIKKLIKGSLRNNFILWITLVVTYFSSYSLSTISWITHFPLWNGNSPNLLW